MAQIFKEEKVVRGKNLITIGEEIKRYVKCKDACLSKKIDAKLSDLRAELGGVDDKLDEAVKNAQEELKKAITSVYRYKGTVNTYEDLPTEGMVVGDVYNVLEPHEEYGPGSNWSWDGGVWDALGGELSEVIYRKDMVVTSEQGFSDLLQIPIE